MQGPGGEAPGPVAAEVTYPPGKKAAAARALQQLGFRIFSIDDTISVSAPAHLWTSTFGVSFEERRRQVEGTTAATPYLQPERDEVDVPDELQGLVADVYFVAPPDYHSP